MILLDNLCGDQTSPYESYMYRLFKSVFSLDGEFDHTTPRVDNHLSMSNLRANIKQNPAVAKVKRVAHRNELKQLSFSQVTGFFGIAKVNLRNAP